MSLVPKLMGFTMVKASHHTLTETDNATIGGFLISNSNSIHQCRMPMAATPPRPACVNKKHAAARPRRTA